MTAIDFFNKRYGTEIKDERQLNIVFRTLEEKYDDITDCIDNAVEYINLLG